ncbi:MAG TPA: hypothetical protein VIW69_01150 [Candidatus Elarobacter sp.]
MFIRFVVDEFDRRSGQRRGVFQVAHRLRDSGVLTEYDHARLADALRWFEEHLNEPARLARSRRPHRAAQAICWFKKDATEHLARIREVQHLLGAYDIVVDMITSRRPGYVVYEDAHQIAAYPFGETRT